MMKRSDLRQRNRCRWLTFFAERWVQAGPQSTTLIAIGRRSSGFKQIVSCPDQSSETQQRFAMASSRSLQKRERTKFSSLLTFSTNRREFIPLSWSWMRRRIEHAGHSPALRAEFFKVTCSSYSWDALICGSLRNGGGSPLPRCYSSGRICSSVSA